MKTKLFYHPAARNSPGIEVILDVSLKEIDEVTDELTVLFKEASKVKRLVGCVIRQFGGTTYFTYDDGNRAQLEINLISALIVPKTDVHVTEEAARGEKWDKY